MSPLTRLPDSLRVARVAARGLMRSRLPSMAAALAFRSLFALIPVLVISLVIVRAVAGPEGVAVGLRQVLDYTGVTSLVTAEAEQIEGEATEAPDNESVLPGQQSAENLPDEADVSEQAKPFSAKPFSAEPFTPESNPADPVDADPVDADPVESDAATDFNNALQSETRLNSWVTERVEQIMTVSLPAIGAVGFATLIYAALSLLFEIERSFNHVYRVRHSGGWVRRITQYWTVLTLGGLFLLGTFYAGDRFQGWAAGMFESDAAGVFLRLLGFAVTVVISTLLFFVGYQAIPATRVHVRASIAGAFIAALMWEIGKWALTQSVSSFVGSSVYAKIYGAIALAPVFMLWIYYTWLIVLFGLQVTFGLQHLSTWNEQDAEDRQPVLADAGAVVALAAYVAERFSRGEPAEIDEAAEATGLPAHAAADLLDRLTDAGLVHPMPEDSTRLALSRPPEKIALATLVGVARDACPRAHDQAAPWSAAWSHLREAQDRAIESRTLADLVGASKTDASAPTIDPKPEGDPEG